MAGADPPQAFRLGLQRPVKPPELERHLDAGDAFRRFARTTSSVVGSAKSFMIACIVIAVW